MKYRLKLPFGLRIPIDRLAFPFLAVVSMVLFFSDVHLQGWILWTWLAVIAILWIASRRLRKKRKAHDARAALAWAAELLEQRRRQRMKQNPHGRVGVGR
jgi:apolipoprotein N-acyltransferase